MAFRPSPDAAARDAPVEPGFAQQGNPGEGEGDGDARARWRATFFVGFPHADIPYAGSSAVVVTDGDAAKAQALCDELLDMAWEAREQFVYRVEPLEQSLARAKDMGAGSVRPVVLLDHYDNCASGGTMDTMAVLGGILDAGLEEVAAFAICDPQAVEQMKRAGVGARVTLPLGGKMDMPALGLKGRPREVTGNVRRICSRPVPQRRPDGARRAGGHGAGGGARHRQGGDRGDLAARGTARHRARSARSASNRRKSAT